MSTEEQTDLQRIERAAMTGDRTAVLQVVSALRRYREVVQAVLSTRDPAGVIDGYHAALLDDAVRAIEKDVNGD